jgi:hypothetical protein
MNKLKIKPGLLVIGRNTRRAMLGVLPVDLLSLLPHMPVCPLLRASRGAALFL